MPNHGEFVVEDHYPFEEDILKIVDSPAKSVSPNLVDPLVGSACHSIGKEASLGDLVLIPVVPALAEVMTVCGAQGVGAPSPGQVLWGDVENSDSLKEDGVNLYVGPSVTRGEEGEIMEEEVTKVKDETTKMDSMGFTQEKTLEEEFWSTPKKKAKQRKADVSGESKPGRPNQ